jgi:molecular chaperone DnaJ
MASPPRIKAVPVAPVVSAAPTSVTFSARCSAISSAVVVAVDARKCFVAPICAMKLELELPQAVFGHTTQIEIPRLMECETCHGSGAAKGSSPVACDQCGGSGQMRISQGIFQLQQPCNRCRGTGRIVKNPCDTCLGQGRVRRTRTLSVKVPAGVSSGDRIRLSGEGEAGRNGGPPGDLYVEINVLPHAIFEREGDDLSCEVPVGFATAVLGGSVTVPTLEGEVSLKIPKRRNPVASSVCEIRASNPCVVVREATCSVGLW